MKNYKQYLLGLMLCGCLVFTVGCGEDKDHNKEDSVVEDAGDAVEDTVDGAGDAVEDVVDA